MAERLGAFAAAADPDALSEGARETCRRLLIDVIGLCVAARRTDYVHSCLESSASSGSVTVFGHADRLGPYDAALVNGTAAHGEDYDDTFEGGPVHAGAVVVPAVLAVAEHRRLDGRAVLKGLSVGTELLCRMSLVAPQAIHRAGFHPTAVLGAPAAAAAVAAAIGSNPSAITMAIGIAGSLASGIIEYLSDGSWTKRLHAGAAAQSGVRAAFLAQSGFVGPRSVLEGTHGFYKAFAPSRAPDFEPLVADLGRRWILETLAFKPYACGTMTQPFVDCAIELAASGIPADAIATIECDVGEGTVHRLWEPLGLKRRPPNGYAAKFSTPYCVAVGFIDGKAGLEQFTDERVADEKVQALAEKVTYRIDPANEYPRNFTGHIKATLRDGTVREIRRPHMRGGAREPLTTEEILAKFQDNTRFGGWNDERANAVAAALKQISRGGQVELADARG
jgi:2-methylcitrate dehydratase PrpD